MRLGFGYHTSGFAHHRLADALRIIREAGYQGAALTLDAHHLDPFKATETEVRAVGALLRRLGLRSVVETGARYVLDPRRRHWPTLVSREGRRRRMAFLKRAVEIAAVLGSEAVSFWSGALEPGADPAKARAVLAEGCRELLDFARRRGATLAFEPEPGMLVDCLEGYRQIRSRRGCGDLFLTLDVGHVPCAGEGPIADRIREFAGEVKNVHIEDVRGRVHEHLPFAEGEIDFPPVLQAFSNVGYRGLINVELSRHSHAAPELALSSLRFLRKAEKGDGRIGGAVPPLFHGGFRKEKARK